ncbi:hypothetical protein E8E01_00345 [Methylorubrum populi]|uniref:hypothetical protein n=1 Tax=Methylorubrum populi TaxID=223967 RepID=UPI00114FC7BD|nr:hypothetical protein [Methylorubrum populi]QDI79005.1 hypothetical protein E8E01_00345 [Methylorubrum populi]
MPTSREALEEAARLLLGPEFKRPLAKLLGPHHPNGARESLDPRLPFRWFADPNTPEGDTNRQYRPIPGWVGPVLARLLEERAEELARDAERARVLSARLRKA